MLHIGICDDNLQQAQQFYNRLQNGAYTHQPLQLHLFHNCRELLASSASLNLLFLDIEMPEMSGIDLLIEHGSRFSDTKIILLTSHTGYVFEGYKYNVYRFLPKQNLSDRLLSEVFESFEKEFPLHTPLQLTYHGASISISPADILYLEANGSYCNITTIHATWKCYIRLKNIIPMLPKLYFFQTHRSYVVNLRYIDKIVDDSPTCHYLIMKNSYRVDISQRKFHAFKEAHTQYILS